MTRYLIVLVLVLLSVGCEQREHQTPTKHTDPEGTDELRPLNWPDVYRVSKHRRVATETELAVVQQQCGELPPGYKEFVTDFGFGSLDDVYVAPPETITEMTPSLRESLETWLEFCEEFGDPAIIPAGFADDAIALAESDWGDYYFVSPSQPGVLWYIWRPHDWDFLPSIIPLGFTNPFLHQNSDGTLTQLGSDAPVFHPDVPRYSQCFAVVPQAGVLDSADGLGNFFQDVEGLLQPDKIKGVDTIRNAYVARWGAEFNFGRRRKQPHYFSIICRADPESEDEIAAFLTALSGRGYSIEKTDWE